jgi:hypothetical protein
VILAKCLVLTIGCPFRRFSLDSLGQQNVYIWFLSVCEEKAVGFSADVPSFIFTGFKIEYQSLGERSGGLVNNDVVDATFVAARVDDGRLEQMNLLLRTRGICPGKPKFQNLTDLRKARGKVMELISFKENS